MSIDRVSTSNQTQFLLSQIMHAQSQLDQTQAQVASGKVATDYGGIGGQTDVLEAARSASDRTNSYATNTQLAVTQADLQNTQLTSLSGLADQLRSALSNALANNDATGLMAQAQSIFDQASLILNSKDSNGNYIYGGDKDNTPPVTVGSLAALGALPSVSQAFANGTTAKSVYVADGEKVQVGLLASNIGTDLMQTLQDISQFNAGANGNFQTTLTSAQSTFLSGELPTAITAGQNLNTVTASNGYTYNRLQDAVTQQQSMSSLYKGFVSNIEDVDMGKAITNLNQNQAALQAALQVTAQLNKVSLLNYLPAA
jgi:flagellar hook-associated protein 3 FlgL